ncbi:AAA family ATPase [Actinomadura scrupuli]|uniref:AAA family ATPase n=1 Tax=Actinomadura scrupuli TaxID=559629 RepID=UPI003D97F623
MNEAILLDRFFQRVHLHLVGSYSESPRRPLILGIFGRAGDGKSLQLSTSLDHCHVHAVRLNAADLESGLAGEPGKHIARTYSAASLAVAKGVPTALVVDDVDTTVGEWEMNTGTVNHQQVLAELMHLADRPVDPDRNRPKRVPIFVTGNNLNRLYAPLRRHGRMDAFPWRPGPEEVRTVVHGVFAGVADQPALDKLAAEFVDEPLSFFAQVRHLLAEAEIAGNLHHVGLDMRAFLRRLGPGQRAAPAPRKVAYEDLIATARRLKAESSNALHDFLQPDPSVKEIR